MPSKKKPELRLPLKLTWGQRKMLAYADPGLSDRLKLDEPNQRIIDFTLAELNAIKAKAETAIQKASTGYERRPLKFVLKTTDQALAQAQRRSVADTVYQLKITLLGAKPPIWRRIQVKDSASQLSMIVTRSDSTPNVQTSAWMARRRWFQD